MIFEDPDPPRKKPATPKPLDTLSIDELTNYIAELEAEIVRVKAAIAAKKSHADAAAAFFNIGSP